MAHANSCPCRAPAGGRKLLAYSADHQSGDMDGKVNPGFKKGIRVGSAKDGKVAAFIPEIGPDANVPEGIAADSSGIIYGGWTGKMNLRRWVKAATQ